MYGTMRDELASRLAEIRASGVYESELVMTTAHADDGRAVRDRPGEHPIVPVMVGDEGRAAHRAAALLVQGLYAVSFSHPVVPRGKARIRTQMSAAHNQATWSARLTDTAQRVLR